MLNYEEAKKNRSKLTPKYQKKMVSDFRRELRERKKAIHKAYDQEITRINEEYSRAWVYAFLLR